MQKKLSLLELFAISKTGSMHGALICENIFLARDSMAVNWRHSRGREKEFNSSLLAAFISCASLFLAGESEFVKITRGYF